METLGHSLRTARIDDIPAIMAVRRAAWLATYIHPGLDFTLDDLLTVDYDGPRQRGYWRRRINNARGDGLITLVAADSADDEPVGFAGAGVGAERAYLQLLYVRPDRQREGIGGALMRAILDWCGPDRPVGLTVVGFNAQAIRFYRRFSFVRSARLVPPERMFNVNGKLMPEVEMVRPAGAGPAAEG